MARESKARLIYEWESGKERYRLIAVANHTPGFEDRFVIDVLERDSLGEPSWKNFHTMDVKALGKLSERIILIDAIKKLLHEEAVRTEPPKATPLNPEAF